MRRVRLQHFSSGQRRDRVRRTACDTRVALAACGALGLIAAYASAQQEVPPPAGGSFQLGEISIGEPVTLPFGAPPAAPSGSPASGAGVAAARTDGESAATAAPRSGWLGMVVAESNVPGRWRVDEVAAGGPAEIAGIRVGDELRAVNGVAPRNADEVSQALTAIVADQAVRVAIGRGDEVSDVLVRATPRPTVGPRVSAAPGVAGPTPQADPPTSTDPIGPAMAAAPPPPFAASPPAASSLPPAASSLPPAASSLPPAASSLPPTAFAATAPTTAASEPTLPPLPDVDVPMAAAPPAMFETPPTMAPRFRSEGAAAAPSAAPATTFVPAAPTWSGAGGAPMPPQPMPPQTDRPSSVAADSVAGVASPAAAPGRRTALGVRTIPIDPVTQARFQLTEPVGAYVIGVVQDLPASRAGVPPGSVIVAIDERPVHSPTELTSLVTSSPVDRPITVRFLLPGGTSRNAAVMLQSIDPPLLQALGAEATASPGPASGGRIARRPVEDAVTSLRREIGILRGSLEQLERRLDGLTAGRR